MKTKHANNYWALYPIKPILLFCAALLNFAGVAAAEELSCTGTKAFFSAESGMVCLPTVALSSPTGIQYYWAQLQWINSSNPLRFKLVNVSEIPTPATATASYSTTSGMLDIPAVEQYELFGTNRYAVNLQFTPTAIGTEFQLANIAAVINGYRAGITWKPYVGLLPNEKSAINVLGNAQAYTNLAAAVYDFGITASGAWQLRETTSTSSGLQAGAYVNNQTNQVVIAFRGTEFCAIPIVCSFEELKESGRDTNADIQLTQGHDSGQFDEAYRFAQQVINLYPGRKIIAVGHSLGGGLAQAVGASFQLETYAFNSSPVPHNFFDAHSVKQANPAYSQIIHAISDIHDPISNTDYSGKLYADASHITPPLFFDFDKKEITPNYKASLDSSRFNKHTIETLRDNIAAIMQTYKNGW